MEQEHVLHMHIQAFSPRRAHSVNLQQRTFLPPIRQSRFLSKNSGDENDKETDTSEKKKSEPISLAELSQREEESSRQVMNRLLLPQRMGQAFNATAYFFIALSLLANVFGYSFFLKDGSITFDTLENRRFQMEINQQSRTPVTPTPPATSIKSEISFD